MSNFVTGLIGGGLGLLSDLFGMSAQEKANRTNIKLQREQLAWQERMANTAVRRAANDIEAAGGNRALAFTTGREASTPTISPARVEPTFRGNSNAVSSMATALQMQQMQAQTRLTNAEAAATETKNLFLWNNEDLRSQILATTRDLSAKQYDLIEQQVKNAVQQYDATALGMEATAQGIERTKLENEKARRTMQAVVDTALQQARAGKIDLEALENIASFHGVEANKTHGVVQTALRLLQSITVRATK